jgi:Phosphotransferase enzyme family
MIFSSERTLVYVDEQISEQVVQELGARELGVERFADASRAFGDATKNGARGIILVIPDGPPEGFLDAVLEASRSALDNGLLVTFIAEREDTAARAIEWLSKNYAPDASGNDQRFRPNLYPGESTNPAKLAQDYARHDPHRSGTDAALEVIGKPPVLLKEDAVLLRRAFSEFKKIQVERLQRRDSRGSAGVVYRVRVQDDAVAGPVSFVVKTLPFSGADAERGIYENFVPKNTPFSNVPPLISDRCVTTSCRSCVVTQFVDRAILFEAYIETHSPALAIASLFDGPLRCWRSRIRRQEASLGDLALEIVSANPAVYEKVYKRALAMKAVGTPADLIARIRATPRIDVSWCFSHGDLHLRNIFVKEGSSDVVLIDLNRAGDHPASRDPAELDAALAFSGVTGAAPLHSTIARLYRPPLLEPQPLCRPEPARALAIEQLRRQVVGSTTEAEYRVMLAAHCLYWARKGVVDAYIAADELI